MVRQGARCDRCGAVPPEGLTRWWTEEVVRPARHYHHPPSRSRSLATDGLEPPPIPTLRNTYATRRYDLCASCYAEARQEADLALAGQKRGMAVVAILGAMGLVWIMATAFLHSDLLGRPLGDPKGWIYATPPPSAYKDPLGGVPAAKDTVAP